MYFGTFLSLVQLNEKSSLNKEKKITIPEKKNQKYEFDIEI